MAEYPLQLSPEEIFRYQAMAEMARSQERGLWEAAGFVEGARVADVGCGPGAVSVVLAGLVGPHGMVAAVDRDSSAQKAAVEAAAQAGLDNVTVSSGEAHDTGLEPGRFDAVMIRHVLAHNGGREQDIVSHAAKLVRPGGSVYLVDIDGTALRVRPPVPAFDDLNQRYFRWHHDRGNDLSAGLRLAELLETAGLVVEHFSGRYQIFQPPPGFRPPGWAARDALVEAGLAGPDDVDRWAAAFERLDRGEVRPTAFVSSFIAFGRRRHA